MNAKTTKTLKIIAGSAAFAVIMAAIIWIVALALIDSDIKSEVYGAEFDYVDDIMYDNAYITMKGGRWQLYRGGDPISRTFGHLEYIGKGRFSFISSDGKGWGIVRTDGSVEIDFNGDFSPLVPKLGAGVGVRKSSDEFTVRNKDGRNYRVKGGKLVEYSDFEAFYKAYGDKYAVYYDESDKLMALDTRNFKSTELPFKREDKAYYLNGFLTVESEAGTVTYDEKFEAVEFLAGLKPENDGGAYFGVVDGRAVAYGVGDDGNKCRIQSENGFIEFELQSGGKVVLTDGTTALAASGSTYWYFDGNTVREIWDEVRHIELTGGNGYVFRFSASEDWYIIDERGGVVRSNDIEEVSLYRTKEKNRAQYTVEIKCLIADGKLYGYLNGELKKLLDNVISVMSNERKTESRIVTQTAEKTEIFDSFFRSVDRRTNLSDPDIIDAFLLVYSEMRDGKCKIVLPRGEFEAGVGSRVEIVYCTDESNYFALETLADGSKKLYSRNGGLLGGFTLTAADSVVLSQNQYVIIGKDEINIVSRGRKLNVKYDDIHFSGNNKYAVAVRTGGLTVINLNDGNIDDERVVSGGVEITETGENTFVFKSEKTGLYGIIDNGRMTLSPTFRQMKLHDGFVIASVDGKGVETATYFQADFGGRRISKIYADLQMQAGLTVCKTIDGSVEITNARGRVILKDVTYFAEGFKSMDSKVYDEETGLTVDAVRNDNSHLFVVTAAGYKRVISVARDTW